MAGEARLQEKTSAMAWGMLAVIYFASFMAPITQFKVPPLASWLIPEYGIDAVTFGYLMSGLSIIGVILAFPAAFICRRFGLKKTMIISVAALALGSLISALANSVAFLMIARMVEGIGIGLIGVAAPSCVSVWFPDKTRGLALGIWATWMPVGITVMFNIAPSMAMSFGWHSVLWICFALCAIALVVFALAYRVPSKEKEDALAVTGSMSEAFKLLKNNSIWILGITFFVFNFLQIGVINSFYNTFLETERGMDPAIAASLTSVTTILSIFTVSGAGVISDRTKTGHRRYWLMACYALFIVAFLLAWNTGEGADATMWGFILVCAIAGGLGGGITRPMAPIIMGDSPAGAVMGMGVLQFFQNLGAAVGAPLFGLGIETLGWSTASNTILIPLCVIAFIASFFLSTRFRKGTPPLEEQAK